MQKQFKPGDIVKHVSAYESASDYLGFIIEWYDSGNGYLNVMWSINSQIQISPCHISKLVLISG